MTVRKNAPRAKTRWGLLIFMVALGLTVATSFVAASLTTIGPVGTAANFEDNDGNLAPGNGGLNFDWNSFDTGSNGWTGSAPYQSRSEVVSGWTFKGLTDAAATTSDTGFAGGTKQDDNCATVKGTKSPNKDDLKRVYLATKTISGHVYLMLAWERIPQNTTSPSAHVGFEFNQSDTACGSTSDGLVQRTAGDMLIVYDFEGSSTSNPTLSIRRWVTSPNHVHNCEVSSDFTPCWGPSTTLSANAAEAAVNTGALGNAGGGISDIIAPSNDTLGLNEFGEAGIDLTNAGVFTAGTCTGFGQAEAISRSSGNSAQAAMMDLVGPADFTLSNCGTVIIRKVTDPSGDTTNSFGYTDDVVSSPATTNSPFSLKDGESNTIINVVATSGSGTYTVTEDDPLSLNYTLSGISCLASTVPGNATTSVASRNVVFTIGAGQTIDCTFTNTKGKASPKADTAPSVIPEDTATVRDFDTSGDKDGLIHFELWSTSTCDTSAGGTLLYSETQTVDANGDYTTANSGDPTGTPAGYTISTSGETDYWKVYYDGDNRNNPFDDGCNESVSPTLVGYTAS
jgi:hypothetical protein